MQHASAIMADDEEAVECAERQRWNSEEIHRGDDFPMIAQEAAIALRLWMATPYPVEITDGQNFGGGQGRTGRSSYDGSRFCKA